MTKRLEALLAVAGLALFAFVVGRIGWSSVITTLVQARTGVLILLALSLARLGLQTQAWSIALRADGVRSSTGELMLIRLASQGLGYLSVLGPLASEPMKISLLRKSGLATTATLVDTGVYWFVSGIVGIAGCISAVLLMSRSHHSVATFSVIGLILAAGLYVIARPKLRLAPLVTAIGARCPRWLHRGSEIEIAIRNFGSQHPSSVQRMLLLDVGCQVLMASEVIAILWCLRIPLHTGTILGIEGATRAVKMAAGWLPARIGADESGIAGAFLAFGLPPAAGFTLALLRRFRDLLGAFIGLSWLAASTRVWKAPSAPIPAQE